MNDEHISEGAFEGNKSGPSKHFLDAPTVDFTVMHLNECLLRDLVPVSKGNKW